LGDTRTPLRFALIRIVFVVALGFPFALYLPAWLGVPAIWGASGLTASAGIGRTGVPASRMAVLWGAALAGAAIGWGVKLIIPWSNPLIRGGLILPAFGVTYLACT